MDSMNVQVELIDAYSVAHGFREEAPREAPADHPESKATHNRLCELAQAEGAHLERRRQLEPEKLPKVPHYDLASASQIVETAILTFGSAGGALALLKGAKDLLIKYLEISSRHEINVTVGDVSIKVKGQGKDLDEVIKTIERLQEQRVAKQKPILDAASMGSKKDEHGT